MLSLGGPTLKKTKWNLKTKPNKKYSDDLVLIFLEMVSELDLDNYGFQRMSSV